MVAGFTRRPDWSCVHRVGSRDTAPNPKLRVLALRVAHRRAVNRRGVARQCDRLGRSGRSRVLGTPLASADGLGSIPLWQIPRWRLAHRGPNRGYRPAYAGLADPASLRGLSALLIRSIHRLRQPERASRRTIEPGDARPGGDKSGVTGCFSMIFKYSWLRMVLAPLRVATYAHTPAPVAASSAAGAQVSAERLAAERGFRASVKASEDLRT